MCADAPPAAVGATGGEPHAASFRDPSGFVFLRDGILYRQVQLAYREHYDLFVSSGLFRSLVGDGLLVGHEESAAQPASPGAYKVLQPSPIDVISYPFEWSFGQLKDAALLTLRVQRRALAHGMVLKDASAYNVQYQRGRPIFIDTLSFESPRGRPAVGGLWPVLSALSRTARADGESRHPPGQAAEHSSRRRAARPGEPPAAAADVAPSGAGDAHPRPRRRAAPLRGRFESNGTQPKRAASVSRRGLIGIVDSLERTILALEWRPAGTEWADYEATHRYAEASQEDKRRLVKSWFDALVPVPERVVDLGANAGAYSRLIAEGGATVVSVDGDPAAVELNYRRASAETATTILPLLADLTNSGSGVGWDGAERAPLFERVSADFTLCLALVHHLAIGHNVPFDRIARWLAGVAPRLIIEFVPKHDEQVQRLLASRVDVFPDYGAAAFQHAFGRYFATERRQSIAGSERTLYQMRRL